MCTLLPFLVFTFLEIYISYSINFGRLVVFNVPSTARSFREGI